MEEVALEERIADRPFLDAGLGYKEIAGYLRGTTAWMRPWISENTRRFAKRQYTWFRADGRIVWLDVDGRTAREVSKQIKETLSI